MEKKKKAKEQPKGILGNWIVRNLLLAVLFVALLIGGAGIGQNGVVAVKVAAGVAVVRFGSTFDGVAVQVPLEGIEAIFAVVDADDIVEYLYQIGVGQVDIKVPRGADFVVGFVADDDKSRVGTSSAVGGQVNKHVERVGGGIEIAECVEVNESLSLGFGVEIDIVIEGSALGDDT